jgi:hypothetical protein
MMDVQNCLSEASRNATEEGSRDGENLCQNLALLLTENGKRIKSEKMTFEKARTLQVSSIVQ